MGDLLDWFLKAEAQAEHYKQQAERYKREIELLERSILVRLYRRLRGLHV